ncbi:MAG: DUF4135 domain-containing protein [Gammaproteobacteria bacterium]|nr:DUF4135 domain-containing protein [Gammaproteobacteria bacterium]
MPVSIDAFKTAFKKGAKAKNDKIRWTYKEKWWQTQTSLKGVVTALDALDKDLSKKNVQAVLDAIDRLPEKKRLRYAEPLAELRREVSSIAVPTTPAVVDRQKINDDAFVFMSGGKALGGPITKTRADFVESLNGKLGELAKTHGFQIDDLDGLIESVVKDAKMGATSSDVDASVWGEALKHVNDTVIPGIAKDLANMKSTGLLGDGAVLKGVKFTGSDFHKGGKQVLILRFEEDGRTKKVVYKPSSLKVDATLFGKDSVGARLGVQTYNIVPMETEDHEDAGYGYMEFVDTGGHPSTGADVLKIYESLAANMALSYYVGLEDVHEENIIVKKDGLQVIDMEATTGVFNEKDDEKSGGFIDQLWNKAIWQGLRVELQKLAGDGKLTSLPKDKDVEKRMLASFKAVIDKLGTVGTDLKPLEDVLAQQTTRTVPIPTNVFQKELIPEAGNYASLGEWKKRIKTDVDRAQPNDDTNVVVKAKATTSTPYATIGNLLSTQGVFDALKRGDVPYYTRQLGSTTVEDEKGEAIDVPGYVKVVDPIDVAMTKRRTKQPKNLYKVFKVQGIDRVLEVQADVAQWIAAKKNNPN